MKKSPVFFLFASLSMAASCAPTVSNRGNLLEPEMIEQLKSGETSREEVIAKIGSPTLISTFDERIWYYAGRQTEQYSFFSPDVIKQQVIEIDFDDKGIVADIKKLDLTQAADASPVDRETPTFGQKNTLLRELIGDFKHPRPDLGNSRRRSGT